MEILVSSRFFAIRVSSDRMPSCRAMVSDSSRSILARSMSPPPTPHGHVHGHEAVRAYCAGKLTHYKIPRYVHIVDGFPMTVTGKVRKVEMRESAIDILNLHEADAIRKA